MEPTLTFEALGYAQRLKSGDIEVQPQKLARAGTAGLVREDLEPVLIQKSDAEKLARFILEGVE